MDATQMIRVTGEATGEIDAGDLSPIRVFGTESIRNQFDDGAIKQAINCRNSPGVSDVVLNPDAHQGYGAPIGCVMASPTHIYPGPVGVDIKCSMSLLQFDLPESEILDKKLRRALINAIMERTPTGAGWNERTAPKARRIGEDDGKLAVTQGASMEVCEKFGIPEHWAARCEDSFHVGHADTRGDLERRLERLLEIGPIRHVFAGKMKQFGSYGGGNHFGECETVQVAEDAQAKKTAETFGLRDGHVAFLSHCGSRGWGALLADLHFKGMKEHFDLNGWELPGGDRHMVHAELGSQMANDYIDDMSMGANFATVNHLLINTLVLDAFQEIIPGIKGELVYFISHNIARLEDYRGQKQWVHRKGATRAFPAGHAALAKTPFANTGHPILLPGNPQHGSAVMVAQAGAENSCFSVNHGAGRRMSRTRAKKELNQAATDTTLKDLDIMTNCRQYPLDEAPGAYKDFEEVLKSVKSAGLASEVARLKARFVIKDGDKADD